MHQNVYCINYGFNFVIIYFLALQGMKIKSQIFTFKLTSLSMLHTKLVRLVK